MFPRVTGVRHVGDYELEITFSDGVVSTLDFRSRVVGRGGVFLPFEELGFFEQVTIDSEAGTLVWPNDVDFCPDVLYADCTGRSIESLEPKVDVV